VHFRRSIRVMFGTLALLASIAASAGTAKTVLARYKAVSGGARWDTVRTLQVTGTGSSGGLSGAWRATQDLVTGRSSDAYKLGPIDGADGYDGTYAWRRDPGGEIAVLDAPSILRHACSQAWLNARAYWYPSRITASYGAIEQRRLDGHRYQVVKATPAGGDPLALWFDTDSGLLARVVWQQGQYTMTSTLDDYRETNGLRLPYHLAIDLTDAAGRTDPRRRIEFHYQDIATNVSANDADFAIPRMSATAHVANPAGITRVPFDLLNNHIYVDAMVNGRKARFLVDTGGAYLLTPAAARKFGLVSMGALAAGGDGDHDMDLGFAQAKNVQVGDAVVADPVFAVIDLGVMPKVEGVDFDGFIGYEMFRRFDITVDYEHRVLTFAEPAKFIPPADAVAIRFDQDDRTPFVNGKLDGLPIRLWVDTGSRSSLTVGAPFVRKNGLLEKYRAGAETVVGQGISGPAHAHPARFGKLQIGSLAIDGLAGELSTSDKGAFADPDLEADLGSGALRHFTIALDYADKRIYLAPNATLGEPIPFDRSGLWLLVDGDALKITDVAKGSAADHAHLRDNDRIVSIDGEPVMKRTLSDWRSRLRELLVGSRHAIEFQRDGKVNKTELVLADRIPPIWK